MASGLSLFNKYQDAVFKQEKKAFQMESKFNHKEAVQNRAWEKMMSDTSHQREVKDLQKAGLNPALSVNSGANAYTSSSASASMESGSGAGSSGYGADASAAAQMYSSRMAYKSALTNASAQMFSASQSAAAQMYSAKMNYKGIKYGTNHKTPSNLIELLAQGGSNFAGYDNLADLMQDNGPAVIKYLTGLMDNKPDISSSASKLLLKHRHKK